MVLRIILVAAMLSMATGLGAAAADDAFIGTWKQNLAKSKIVRGEPQRTRILVLTPYGANGWTRVVLDENDKGEWREEHFFASFDGKDYPTLGGDPRVVLMRRVDANTVEQTFKRNGKATAQSRLVVSKDGKTLTQTGSGVSGNGQRYENDLRVYDRQ